MDRESSNRGRRRNASAREGSGVSCRGSSAAAALRDATSVLAYSPRAISHRSLASTWGSRSWATATASSHCSRSRFVTTSPGATTSRLGSLASARMTASRLVLLARSNLDLPDVPVDRATARPRCAGQRAPLTGRNAGRTARRRTASSPAAAHAPGHRAASSPAPGVPRARASPTHVDAAPEPSDRRRRVRAQRERRDEEPGAADGVPSFQAGLLPADEPRAHWQNRAQHCPVQARQLPVQARQRAAQRGQHIRGPKQRDTAAAAPFPAGRGNI